MHNEPLSRSRTFTNRWKTTTLAAIIAVLFVATGCQGVFTNYTDGFTMDSSYDNFALSSAPAGGPLTVDLPADAGLQFGCLENCTVASVTLTNVSATVQAQLVRCATPACTSWVAVSPLTLYTPTGSGVVPVNTAVTVDDGCVAANRIRLRARTLSASGSDFVQSSMLHICGIDD